MALLRDRVYGPFFFGNLASNCGNWVHNVAAAVVVFTLADSALAVGAVSGCLWAGSLLLQPWAGALTDRYDRRRMLIGGQALALVGALAIAIPTTIVGAEGLAGPWPIYLGTLVIGVGVAFSIPAMQALIPALVEERDLDRAIALNGVTFNIARGIGPAIAGVVLLEADASLAFWINVATRRSWRRWPASGRASTVSRAAAIDGLEEVLAWRPSSSPTGGPPLARRRGRSSTPRGRLVVHPRRRAAQPMIPGAVRQ